MIANLEEIVSKYGLNPRGMIHVGMHKAEEYPEYKSMGFSKIAFIEANRDLADMCDIDDDDCYIIHAAVSDVNEDIQFNITNNLQSSSFLKLKDHSNVYPHIVNVKTIEMRTHTLDQVIKVIGVEKTVWNMLTFDIQGAELKAMNGLSDWNNIDLVYTEVNYREMYVGVPLVGDIDNFLSDKGLVKVVEEDTGCGWGDAIYVKQCYVTG